METLSDLGHKVGFISCVAHDARKEAARSLPPRCKHLPQDGAQGIIRFVEQHAHRYDVLWVSRPHNMALLQRYLPDGHPVWRDYSLVVYDAEAIFALRARDMARLYPSMPSGKPLVAELGLTDVADVVTVVSALDEAQFQKQGKSTVRLAMAFDDVEPTTGFDQRAGFLFVGTLRDHPSPNSDALLWFCEHVAPLLREELGDEFHLDVTGMLGPGVLQKLARPDIKLLGMVPDLAPLYASRRVFISPHRLAAGIPTKILEAAAQGLPVVAPEMLASQLAWQDRVELLTAENDSPASFADACLLLYKDELLWGKLRDSALAAVRRDYSQAVFTDAIKNVLSTAKK
jgi:glycosyltransferase involved in cell wall biosynthesis